MSSPTSRNLHGKVALVTGGTRGLGLAVSDAFARAGATVVVSSRKPEACARVAAELSGHGVEAFGIPCHVGRWEDCDHLVEQVYERLGRVDVLVNNAGMAALYPTLGDVSEELFDKTFAVNVKGAFRLAVAVGNRMVEDGGGSIINVSSVAASQPSAHEVPYAMAKAALECLTVALAHALGPTVRVNTIKPGPFLTDISQAWDMAAFQRMARRSIPLERGGEPHEIVGAALYFASDASSYTTGATLKVDGGAGWSPA